jgi:hypothetical protein
MVLGAIILMSAWLKRYLPKRLWPASRSRWCSVAVADMVHVRANDANVAQSQLVLQLPLILIGLSEQHAGIEKQHRRFRRDTGDKMQQDRSVAAECHQGDYLAA